MIAFDEKCWMSFLIPLFWGKLQALPLHICALIAPNQLPGANLPYFCQMKILYAPRNANRVNKFTAPPCLNCYHEAF